MRDDPVLSGLEIPLPNINVKSSSIDLILENGQTLTLPKDVDFDIQDGLNKEVEYDLSMPEGIVQKITVIEN